MKRESSKDDAKQHPGPGPSTTAGYPYVLYSTFVHCVVQPPDDDTASSCNHLTQSLPTRKQDYISAGVDSESCGAHKQSWSRSKLISRPLSRLRSFLSIDHTKSRHVTGSRPRNLDTYKDLPSVVHLSLTPPFVLPIIDFSFSCQKYVNGGQGLSEVGRQLLHLSSLDVVCSPFPFVLVDSDTTAHSAPLLLVVTLASTIPPNRIWGFPLLYMEGA